MWWPWVYFHPVYCVRASDLEATSSQVTEKPCKDACDWWYLDLPYWVLTGTRLNCAKCYFIPHFLNNHLPWELFISSPLAWETHGVESEGYPYHPHNPLPLSYSLNIVGLMKSKCSCVHVWDVYHCLVHRSSLIPWRLQLSAPHACPSTASSFHLHVWEILFICHYYRLCVCSMHNNNTNNLHLYSLYKYSTLQERPQGHHLDCGTPYCSQALVLSWCIFRIMCSKLDY